MKVRVFDTPQDATRAAAHAVAAQLSRQPASVLGLPTGRTMVQVYSELVRRHAAGEVDFSRAHTFNIDEFVGISSKDHRSYCAFMQQHLFSHVNLPSSHVHFLDGAANDHGLECSRFEEELASIGGLDFLLLGIGDNAHIGFNEPRPSLQARTHRASLAVETRRANASRFQGNMDDVPSQALTMGICTLLGARTICLIATGSSKAPAVASMFSGSLSTYQPASFLQLHNRVEVVLDLAAAEKLPESGFGAQP
jgi:glucosamine-6-phosphate deaminase